MYWVDNKILLQLAVLLCGSAYSVLTFVVFESNSVDVSSFIIIDKPHTFMSILCNNLIVGFLMSGVANYFRIGLTKKLFQNLMSWIRRRLRMMIMKGWKSWKPLHRQLRRMGYKGKFEKISVTRWRNSSTTPVHMALPNEYFLNIGLYPLDSVVGNTSHQYYQFVLNKV